MNQPKTKTRAVILDKWTFDIEEYVEAGEVSRDAASHQVGVGWVPHGGLVLRNVYHGGFRLAHDLGVTRIWIFPGAKARAGGHKPKYLVLGPPDFSQLDERNGLMRPEQPFDVVKMVRKPEDYRGFSEVNNMNVYNASTKGELLVRWISTLPLFGKESGYVFVTQRFILTDYSGEPAHEPSGSLMAARLHPITTIHYEHVKEGHVESFRIDYRIYANLDSWWYRRVQLPHPWVVGIVEGRETETKGKTMNSAGLFKDDDTSFPVWSGVSTADIVFEAAEKPLKYEVIADGLDPSLGRMVWDNLHWWGVNPEKGSVSPSAPGAFHALHVHWRWSRALQEGSWWTPGHSGEQQFKGKGAGGILVDPRIDRQKLKIAVVCNDGLPDDLSTHSSKVFDAFFRRQRGKKPADIAKGGDLVLYYSVEVPALEPSSTPQYSAAKILQGEVFVHGMFFAHELEKESMTTGTQGAVYIRPAEGDVPRAWRRNPHVKD